MALRFRRGHILALLQGFQQTHFTPLDRYIRGYLGRNKAIGAHDRREITQIVYEITRHQLYLETIVGSQAWEHMLDQYIEPEFNTKRLQSSFPPYIKHSFPLDLYETLRETHGDQTEALLAALNTRAPLTIRVNTLKTTLDDLIRKLGKYGELGVKKCVRSPYGLQLASRSINLLGTEEYKEGLFEVQDEGSQLCALQVQAQSHHSVLDYCAGSGGKSLAMACHLLCSLALYDIRPLPLTEARKRLQRAGVRKAQVYTEVADIKERFDCVVVDVPCSGTGTIRRNPDLKWTFRKANLGEIAEKQLEIVSKAVKYVNPGGELVYMTCSLLRQENGGQIGELKARFGLSEVAPALKTDPVTSDMDGFFAIRMKSEIHS